MPMPNSPLPSVVPSATSMPFGASRGSFHDDSSDGFVDRRSSPGSDRGKRERRQFGSGHWELSDAGRELALAIDQYKLQNHRRYLTCDEMLVVMAELGYAKIEKLLD